MESIMAEMPLAIFTTCALMGAGTFAAQGLAAVFAGEGSSATGAEEKRSLDWTSLAPVLLVVVGFCAAFAHLANPLNAPFALMGIGVSPLSNEIVVGVVFLAAAIVYCLLVSMGKLSDGARKVYAVVLGVAGLVFALFTGLAYFMNTILSWGSPYTVLEALGLAVFAGGVLFAALASAGKTSRVARNPKLSVALVVVIVAGFVVGLGALAAHVVVVQGYATAIASGAAVAGSAMPYLAGAAVCGAAATGLAAFGLLARKVTTRPGVLVAASFVALTAVFLARLAFYALQMSVGL